jgi:hypothetical protein
MSYQDLWALVARRPLQPHPHALEGHHWSPRGGRVCGSGGGLVRGLSRGERGERGGGGGGVGGGSDISA